MELEPPIIQSMLIAEIVVHRSTDIADIIGLRHQFKVNEFPAKFSFHVVFIATGVREKCTLTLKLTRLGEMNALTEWPVEVDLSSPLDYQLVDVHVQEFRATSPGSYACELFCENQPLQSCRFAVVQG